MDLSVQKLEVHLHCSFWVISLRARSLGFPGGGASNLAGYWSLKNDTIFVKNKEYRRLERYFFFFCDSYIIHFSLSDDPFFHRITNSPIADVFVVWAKCEDGKVRGFILEKVCSSKKCCPSLCVSLHPLEKCLRQTASTRFKLRNSQNRN